MEVKNANLVINEYAMVLSQTQKELILLKAYVTELAQEKADMEQMFQQEKAELAQQLEIARTEISRLNSTEILDHNQQG